MKKLYSIALLLSFFAAKSTAQCTVEIPVDVHVISSDSLINNSFMIAQSFLICPGNTLTVQGNSTGFNRFFIENNATVVFDSVPGTAPYGMYSFWVKSGGMLIYNDNSIVSFPMLDTLIWEQGAVLADTGSLFMFDTICNSIVFDYYLIGGPPCMTTNTGKPVHEDEIALLTNPCDNCIITGTVTSGKLQVYDLLGHRVRCGFSEAANGVSLQFQQDITPGVYFIRNLENGRILRLVKG